MQNSVIQKSIISCSGSAFGVNNIIKTALLALVYIAIFAPAIVSAQEDKIVINDNGFTSSETCGSCHSQIYDRWKESMHAGAISDPIFRASYMMAFFKDPEKSPKLCLRCHAPTTIMADNPDIEEKIAKEGVTCDFCHSIRGISLDKVGHPFDIDTGKTKYGPHKKGSVKVHDVAYSRLHSSAVLCASCHEYKPGGVPVMTTYSEWKASPYADQGKQCQYCHMPETEGDISNDIKGPRDGKIFDHNLAGGHSITQLQKALALKIVNVTRDKDRMTVNVDVTNVGSGHRVPTGIPTRKLLLFCEVRVPGGKVYKERIVYEKAIFDKNGTELTEDSDIMLGLGASVAKDNRIFPKETRKESFTFYIPGNKEAQVAVWAEYLYRPLLIQAEDMRIEMNRDNIISSP